MGILDAGTSLRRFLINEVKKETLEKCIYSERACSVIAHDADGDVVGVKLGFTTTQDKLRGRMFYYPALEYLYWILPEVVINLNTMGWYLEEQKRFHPNKAMEDLVRHSCCITIYGLSC